MSSYDDFLKNLLEGDRQACLQNIEDLIDEGLSLRCIYLDYIKRAMYDIGTLWEKSEIAVATEHMATAIVEGIMNAVALDFMDAEDNGKTVVFACSTQEHHQVGIKMVADFFESNGWRSYFVGANTPPDDMVRFVQEKKADLIGLSLSIDFNLKHLEEALATINQSFPDLQIILGGQATHLLTEDFCARYKNLSVISNLDQLGEYLDDAAA